MWYQNLAKRKTDLILFLVFDYSRLNNIENQYLSELLRYKGIKIQGNAPKITAIKANHPSKMVWAKRERPTPQARISRMICVSDKR